MQGLNSLVPQKQGINLPFESYCPCTRRVENILVTRNEEFRTEKAVKTNLVTSSLIDHPKTKVLCLMNFLQIYHSFV